MTRPIFIFISSLLILFPIVVTAGPIAPAIQLGFCMPFILLLGIPHGAIDNVLYIQEKEMSQAKFIGVYLLFIGFNVLIWLIYPPAGYISFLVLSAYHFGQSQFSHYLDNQHMMHKSVYLLWGISILSALIYFNLGEIQLIVTDYSEFAVFDLVHNSVILRSLFFISTGLTAVTLGYLANRQIISLEVLAMEFLVLASILVCFYLMPLLIGFTLYFVILHSLKVLREEFSFLNIQDQEGRFNVKDFIKLVAPFTLLSIFGIAFLFVLIHFQVIQFSYGYVFLITVSSITIPHAFVMNKFYNLLSFRGLNRQVTT